MIKIYLKLGKDKLPRNRHPWIFSGAIAEISQEPFPGETVAVYNNKKEFIAYGHYNPSSKIQVRIFSWKQNEIPNQTWYAFKIRQAINLRIPMLNDNTDSIRLIFSDADNLPGLIVDKLGDYLVVQLLTAGMDNLREQILEILIYAKEKYFPNLKAIIERSDGDGRRLEKLKEHCGILWGEIPNQAINIRENCCDFQVDLNSQKTGFYTDQRENRNIVAPYCKGKSILDVCTYSGAFTINALKAGATKAHLVDISADALNMAKTNLKIAGYNNYTITKNSAFKFLRQQREKYGDASNQYQVIILDPPKLVSSRASLIRGTKAYKDLNLQAISLLPTDGILATFSCSGLVDMKQFREIIAFAAKDAGRDIQILHHLYQSPCHPIRVAFPESQYLKGLLIHIL